MTKKLMTRILLVDDDESLRRMLRITLTKKGYHVIEAANGNEAMQLCQKGVPDLVLTDLIMPEKEGLETIIEMQKLYPKLKIIAMSGGGRGNADDYLNFAAKMGASRTLNKPFSNEEMITAITELCGPK